MRVVIDGLPLSGEGDTITVVERLLQAWNGLHVVDEVHLIVGATPDITVPDWVVVHTVPSGGGRIGRRLARAVSVPRLCRSLKAHVLLGIRPTRAIASLACPRGTVVYDLPKTLPPAKFAPETFQGQSERAVWAHAIGRLRLTLVDTLAVSSWHARRFHLAPVPLWASTTASDARAPVLSLERDPAARRPFRVPVRPQRSLRWIGAVSASTLALSAAAAASVSLVTSQNVPVTTPQHLAPSVSHTSPAGALPSVIPLPALNPTTPTTTPSTTSSSGVLPTTPSSTPSIGGTTIPLPTGQTVTGATLPSLPLPIITIPSLPLPTLTCPSTTTTNTSPLSILPQCGITIGGQTLGIG